MTIEKACEIFPLIDGDEFQALKRDIAEHGQREPIIYVDGEIIDGRNRLRACEELGIEPKIRNLTADEAGDVFSLVMSLNFHRRHLKPHEKGAALKAFMAHVGARAGKTGRTKKSDTVSDIPKTLPAVAAKLGIDERTAQRHIAAAEDYAAAEPEARAKVDAGEITARQAHAQTVKKTGLPGAGRSPREKKPTSEKDAIDDCVQAIEDAIRIALEKHPTLRRAIAAQLRTIEKGLHQ